MQSRKVIQNIQLTQTMRDFDTQRKNLESIIDEYKVLTATLAKMTNLYDIRAGMNDAASIRRRMAACLPGLLETLNQYIALMATRRQTKNHRKQTLELLAYQARYTALLRYTSETNPIMEQMGTKSTRVSGNTCANQELEDLYRTMPHLRPTNRKRQR